MPIASHLTTFGDPAADALAGRHLLGAPGGRLGPNIQRNSSDGN